MANKIIPVNIVVIDEQYVRLPHSAKILNVRDSCRGIVMDVLVDPEEYRENQELRRFLMYGPLDEITDPDEVFITKLETGVICVYLFEDSKVIA